MRRPRTYRSSPQVSRHIEYRRNSGSRPDSILSPLTVEGILHDWRTKFTKGYFSLRITNKNLPVDGGLTMIFGRERRLGRMLRLSAGGVDFFCFSRNRSLS